MSGQSVADRLMAAKHSIAGHGLAKSVCKATTEEVMGPKKKHLDYLVLCTNEPNVSIPQLANLLIERTQSQNWVIVFKSLITAHNIMNFGNERFTQYLASNNCSFNLGGFRDKTGVQGYDMSTFIRRYAKYLNEKAVSYRLMAFDFCKVKRGKEDGLLRTMNADKLLKTLPALQAQLDALLEFDCTPNELTNGVINACFMLMFKDLIRLFACYNDGIINLLEKYFEMNKKQCRDALEIYRRFLVRMDRVSEFLKVAENVGIDKGEIPDLAKAPSSLLEALEEHLRALEAAKKGGATTTTKAAPAPASVATAINTLSGAPNPNAISDEEKRRILEEETRRMEELRQKREGETPTSATNPFVTDIASPASPSNAFDLLGAGSPVTSKPQSSNEDDLLSLAGPPTNPFASIVAQAPAAPTSSSPWANTAGFGMDMVDATKTPPQGFDGFGEVLQPMNQTSNKGPVPQPKSQEKLIKGDLDSSLSSLISSLGVNGPSQQVKKAGHQWQPQGEKKLTGGGGWQTQPGTFPAGQPAAQPMPPMMTAGGGGMMMGQPMGQPVMMPGYTNGYMAQNAGSMGGQPMMGAFPGQPMGARPGAPMYGAQQPMFGQPQQSQQQQPNDPFGAL